MDEYKLIDNVDEKQYEFHVGDSIVKVEYIKTNDGEIYLTHTETPVSLEGQGIASQLMGKVLQDIEQKELRLVPLCPFVTSYIRKNPEWRKLVVR